MGGSLRTSSRDALRLSPALPVPGVVPPPGPPTLPEFRRVEAAWFTAGHAASMAAEKIQAELDALESPQPRPRGRHLARWLGGAAAIWALGASLLIPVSHSVRADLRLEPVTRVALLAPGAGVIRALECAEGQWVERGAVLATVRREVPAAEARQFEQLRYASARADAAVTRAAAALRHAGKGARLARARQRAAQAQSTATAAHQRLVAFGASGAGADELRLRAPASGTVSGLALRVGSRLAAGARVLNLEDRRQQRGVATLAHPERLRAGNRVEVRVPGGTRATTIARLDGNQVEVVLDDPPRTLPASATLEATFEETPRPLLAR